MLLIKNLNPTESVINIHFLFIREDKICLLWHSNCLDCVRNKLEKALLAKVWDQDSQ